MKKIYFTLMAIAAVSFVACNSGSGDNAGVDSAHIKDSLAKVQAAADSAAKAALAADTTKQADTTKPAAEVAK